MNLQEQKKEYEDRIKKIDEALKDKSKIGKEKGKARFFTFSQNNSGGSFISNEEVCEYVIIEAYSPKEANLRAYDIGIYFDGCDLGQDCSCCGDRWSKMWDDEKGDELPSIYDKPVNEIYKEMFRTQCIIYYLNGEKKKIIFKSEKDCPKHDWENRYNLGNKCKICGRWEKE